MFKKIISKILVFGIITTGISGALPTPKADALILAAIEHHPHQSEKLCICGFLCLFIVPPVGIILDIKSLVKDFDRQLPFLANNLEGMLLKSEITKLARVVKLDKKNRLKINKKELDKVNKENPGKFIGKEEIKLKVKIISHEDGKSKGGIVLEQSLVENILKNGDYTQEETDRAIAVLCEDSI